PKFSFSNSLAPQPLTISNCPTGLHFCHRCFCHIPRSGLPSGISCISSISWLPWLLSFRVRVPVCHFSLQPCCRREPFLHHFAPFSALSFSSSLAHQPLTISNCTTGLHFCHRCFCHIPRSGLPSGISCISSISCL